MPRASLALALLFASVPVAVGQDPRPVPAAQFDRTHNMVKRQKGEWLWAELPWSINFAEAQRRSVTEGKPIFVVMAAHGCILGGLCNAAFDSRALQLTDPTTLFQIQRDYIPYAHPGFSGRNCFRVVTATGKVLAEHDRYPTEILRPGLLAWDRLPEAERRPRDLRKVKEYPEPPEPPKNGVILRAHIRGMQRDEDGDLTWTGPLAISNGVYDLKPEPVLDHVWLTEEDKKSMIPFEPTLGDVIRVHRRIAERIATFHLIDKGLGHNVSLWEKATCEMKLKVMELSDTHIGMSLTGMARIGKNADDPVRLMGCVKVDRVRGEFTRFDMLAIGRDDGDIRTADEKVARSNYWYRVSPGSKVVLAIAFELIEPTKPLDRVPPHAIMIESERTFNRPYFGKN